MKFQIPDLTNINRKKDGFPGYYEGGRADNPQGAGSGTGQMPSGAEEDAYGMRPPESGSLGEESSAGAPGKRGASRRSGRTQSLAAGYARGTVKSQVQSRQRAGMRLILPVPCRKHSRFPMVPDWSRRSTGLFGSLIRKKPICSWRRSMPRSITSICILLIPPLRQSITPCSLRTVPIPISAIWMRRPLSAGLPRAATCSCTCRA